MNCLRCVSFGHFLSGLVLFIALFTTACDRQAGAPSIFSEPGEVHTFTGTWSATGDRQTMQLGAGHKAQIFRLSGTLLLAGEQRLRKGFKAVSIGFSDNLKGGLQGRSVWTDDRGDKVFSEFHGPGEVPGELIEGRFLGGTGRYARVSGEYTFRWKRLINNENGEVSGRVVDLKGWVRDGAPETPPTTTRDEQ
jgi:hypothetical protein